MNYGWGLRMSVTSKLFESDSRFMLPYRLARARISALRSLLAVVLVVLVGCNEIPVIQDLSQAQAHQVIAALADHGIESRAERGKGSKASFSVELSSGEYARAIQILRDEGLPGEVRPSVNELLSSDGLLPPGRDVELMKLDRAVAGEIEELLSAHPAIATARAVVRSAAVQEQGIPPSVSIVLTTREAISEDQVRALVRQVAPGVSPESISIVLENVRPKAVRTGGGLEGAQPLSPFLFFWRVPQSDVLALNLAVFGLVLFFGLVAAGLGFASGTARANNAGDGQSYGGMDAGRTALPAGPSVTGSRLRLSELRGDNRPPEGAA